MGRSIHLIQSITIWPCSPEMTVVSQRFCEPRHRHQLRMTNFRKSDVNLSQVFSQNLDCADSVGIRSELSGSSEAIDVGSEGFSNRVYFDGTDETLQTTCV